MSNVYFTSDWHLGHKGISERFRTCFKSDYHHDNEIVESARDVLTKRDVVYMVGDMAFTVEGMEMIQTLPGRKVLVRGNHDCLREEWYTSTFDAVHGALQYRGAFITHIPIHPTELYRRPNIHGHCHKGGPREMKAGDEWWKYYNVILEFNNYKLVPADKVFDSLKKWEEQYSS